MNLMLADLNYIIWWWLVIFGLGALTFPLLTLIFRSFWDKGYIFTKITSLALITYTIFVLSVFHFLPFNQSSLFYLILLAVGANLVYLFKDQARNYHLLITLISQKYRIFLFEELLFLVVLIGWSWVRGFAPDIEGLEKFMDWGFVNTALRSQFLPPIDMWFAGEPINYYYFGHLVFALATKLSTIPSTYTYNLAIATICALTFCSSLSLVTNLTLGYLNTLKASLPKLRLALTAGLVSALMLTFGGNLHWFYKVTKNNLQNNGHLVFTKEALTAAASTYWYPDATRFIGFDPDVNDKTIHEFPVYSFVVADLHGHLNDVPVVLLILAFILVQFIDHQSESSPRTPRWFLIIPLAWLLSVAYMTNAWDFAVYGLVFAAVSFFNSWQRWGFIASLWQTLVNGILTVVFWYFFTLPFSLNFTPMAEGLRLSDAHTPFYQLFILYGGFWLIVLPFIIRIFSQLLRRFNFPSTDTFALALIAVATLLIIIPEIGYIKDIYVYEHRRANTMFKLVYQAFILYSLVSGYLLVRLSRALRFPLKPLFQFVFLLVFAIHMTYPYFAIKSYYGLREYRGIYGLKYLSERYPDNFAAISWLNRHVVGQPTIVEAVGDSYTDYDHMSISTGLPTIQGWVVHEWLWRGGYDKPAARQGDVQKIYESSDLEEVRNLLQKYDVTYIILGAKEYEKYPSLNEANIAKLGQVVFRSGATKIYQVN
jgi:uncharacterized membrane protein